MNRCYPLLAALALAGCAGFGPSDPLADVPRVGDVTLVDEDAVAIAAPSEEGFFAGLFKREPAAAPDPDEVASPGLLAGIFGGAAASEPAAPVEVVNQSFGAVTAVCGVNAAAMGTRIAAVSGYEVYDTAPNTTTPRPHLITGFKDGCPRKFTAALVLTGDVGTHEVVRYQTAQAKRPYTAVDTAYETIKAGFCGAVKGKPCGNRINALARNTTFITGYERFASSPTWLEILLHDGAVAAVSVDRE